MYLIKACNISFNTRFNFERSTSNLINTRTLNAFKSSFICVKTRSILKIILSKESSVSTHAFHIVNTEADARNFNISSTLRTDSAFFANSFNSSFIFS